MHLDFQNCNQNLLLYAFNFHPINFFGKKKKKINLVIID